MAEQDQQSVEKRLSIVKMYVKDFSFESPQGEPVTGFGFRYLRKVGSRAYLESLFTVTLSDDPRFDREGAFVTYHVLF